MDKVFIFGGGYLLIGCLIYWLFFSGTRWTMGEKNIAPAFISLFWPIWLLILVLAVLVGTATVFVKAVKEMKGNKNE